jgi:arabinoxylan arabinofuranohydrolase
MSLARIIRRPPRLAAAVAALLAAPYIRAADPIIQTSFTADPAPMVHDGVVYLYTSHDEDDAPPGQGRFLMRDWKCYTSTDMANWTDHGTVASLATFPWAEQSNDAWAPQVVARNGRFYLYVPISVPGWPKNVIAVAVADNPLGPFKDALGRPLIDRATGYIDPTVLIDDDGQAYLYFGNPNLWYVKLNSDMTSWSGGIVQVPTKPDNYQEGPWLHKHGAHYYLAYASTCCPEGIGYAMSDRPTGPWKYQGYIVKPDRRSTGNHPGIVDFQGHGYVFGFNYKLNFALTDKHHERRSVCVERFDYNPDGSIPELPWWEEAPPAPQLGTVDPFRRVEAETICWSEGVKTAPIPTGGMCTYATREGAYIKVKGVDFAAGAKSFRASVAAAKAAGTIEVRLDSVTGPIVVTLPVVATGGDEVWKSLAAATSGVTGVHDLFFVFGTASRETRFKFDWWLFEQDRRTSPAS